jgi:hypothetical protein
MGDEFDPLGCGVGLDRRAVVTSAIGDEDEPLFVRQQAHQAVERALDAEDVGLARGPG